MDASFVVRAMTPADLNGVVALQRLCFPEPFPADQLWNADHLAGHLEIFPQGQFVASADGQVIGSASCAIISESNWCAHQSWEATLGGPLLAKHEPAGTTLYGVDLSVDPAWRRVGVGRTLYAARFALVRTLGLKRYGTGCRLPDFAAWATQKGSVDVDAYARLVTSGEVTDRTLTPLIRMGLRLEGTVRDYMKDEESLNCAALLEWTP